jgi:hypothetical protein
MEKKRTNSDPLRESTRKHSIYPPRTEAHAFKVQWEAVNTAKQAELRATSIESAASLLYGKEAQYEHTS